MSTASRIRNKTARFAARLVSVAACIWGLGVAYVPPAMAATDTTVPMDQQPLTVQKPLAPNIVLMLDDSGSMLSDYMPDWKYLDTTKDALRYSGNNGTYYNPDVAYDPPPMADGSSNYPASPGLGDAFADGFLDRSDSSEVDVPQYTGSYKYFEKFLAAPSSYDPVLGCYGSDSMATDPAHQGQCESIATSSSSYYKACKNGDSVYWSSNWTGCFHDQWGSNNDYYYDLLCKSGDQLGWDRDDNRWKCNHVTNTYTYYPATVNTCPSGGTYDTNTGKCVVPADSYSYLFTYTTKNSDGSYTRHYVGKTQSDCAAAPSGSTCDYSEKTQQNVANWFSYYHTRILMAKTGVLSAFANLDPEYRVGFGSINDTGKDDVIATGHYVDDFHDLNIAQVEPFGDGTEGTQKAYLWNWVNNIKPDGSTPLRQALDAVGQYYETQQPWQTSDSDETCHACRLAYTILTTDGFWNGDSPGVGDVDGADGPLIQGPLNTNGLKYTTKLPYADQGVVTTAYSKAVWNAADCKSYYKSVTGTDNGYEDSYFQSSGWWGGTCKFSWTALGAGYENTLADVAMKYWANDLRTDIDNEVPTSIGKDNAFWQHMTTFTLGLGFPAVDGDNNNAPLDIDALTAWANGGTAVDGFTQWPKPSKDNINNIADLAHAAINGHGEFASATNPEAFRSSLASALNRASERNGTGASLAANSTELKQGTFTFQAEYVTSQWTGELNALAVDPTSGAIAQTPTWSATQALPAAADRNIYVSTGTSMVEFKNTDGSLPTGLTSDELDELGADSDKRAEMIDYLRGDSSKEERSNGPYRTRATPLGDIVDSQPVFAGPPNANQFVGKSFTGSTTFATYASDQASRDDLLYVAANDGMLHAFDADTGVEKFAFIPAAVLTDGADLADGTRRGLSVLSHTDYGSDTSAGRHQFFNDGELTIADAYFDSKWHTVLVVTTGRGMAKAIYALDITDPDDITFLWERSAHDGQSTSDYIGQMTGKPVIAQTQSGSWSVLMGNGYNSKNGTAALLEFDLADGTLYVHKTNSTTGNGLAAPAVWIGSRTDAISTVAYAGDFLGNVWSFNLYDETNKKADTTSSGTLRYVAKDANGDVQPITGGMLAGRNPDTNDLWLFFGTGRYLAAEDLTDAQLQTWYGLIVESGTTGRAVTSTTTRTSLTEQTIIAQTEGSSETTTDDDGTKHTVVTLPARVVSTNELGENSGWYLDLQTPVLNDDDEVTGYEAIGERMVTPSQFQGSLLVGTTRLPKALDVCNPSGSGWVMAVDPFTGGNPDPDFFDLNGDGVIDSADRVKIGETEYAAAGVGFSSLPNNPIFVGGQMLTSFDNGTTSSIHTSGAGSSFKRVSWRELIGN